MSCQTLPCWSEKAELSVERRKAVNPSNVMTVGSAWAAGDAEGGLDDPTDAYLTNNFFSSS
jgi:hypothetical protein